MALVRRARSSAEVPAHPFHDTTVRASVRVHELTTGDHAFDARHLVQGHLGVGPSLVLTGPLREVLLAHDVVVLLAYRGGAWVGVGHDGPAGQPAAEATALQALSLLVRT